MLDFKDQDFLGESNCVLSEVTWISGASSGLITVLKCIISKNIVVHIIVTIVLCGCEPNFG